MPSLGGFFELELNVATDQQLHSNAIKLNSGRSALAAIIQSNRFQKIHIPYYTCNVLLEVFNLLKIEYDFYTINKDLLPKPLELGPNEGLLVTNYFGIMDDKIEHLSVKYQSKLIVDNSQALYHFIPNSNVFYSPRKFVGIPDGGYAYSVKGINSNSYKRTTSTELCSHLLKRIDMGAEEAYQDFIKNDKKLEFNGVYRMSRLTESLLSSIDFESIKKTRNENFQMLKYHLNDLNDFAEYVQEAEFECPMIYPFLREGNDLLKEHLISKKIYVATYWPVVQELITDEKSLEFKLVKDMIPLPIDQRLNERDMDYIVKIIRAYIDGR